MFNKIQNPETGNWVNINGSVGKLVLRNYVRQMNGGSSSPSGGSSSPRLFGAAAAALAATSWIQGVQKKLNTEVDDLSKRLGSEPDIVSSDAVEDQEISDKKIDTDVEESLYLFSRIHILADWAKSTNQGIKSTWWDKFKHHYPYALLSNIIYDYGVNRENVIEWDQTRKWYKNAKENKLFLSSSNDSSISPSDKRDLMNIYYSPTATAESQSIQVHYDSPPDKKNLVNLEIKFWRKQGTGITTLIYDVMYDNTLIIMVIYRGTASLSDIKSNIKQIVPGKRNSIPFNQDLREFKLYLNDAIKYNNPTAVKIFITGHSLGGTRSIHLASELYSIRDNINPIIKKGNSSSSLTFVGGGSSSSLNKIQYTITTIVFNPGISPETPLKESCLNKDTYNKYREGVMWVPEFCKNLTIHRIDNDEVSKYVDSAYSQANAGNSQVHTHRFRNENNTKILGIFKREKFSEKNWLNAHIMDHFILRPFNTTSV